MYTKIKIAYWIGCFSFLVIFYKWIMPDWRANLFVAFLTVTIFIIISETFIHYIAIPKLFQKKKYRLFLLSMFCCFLLNGFCTLLLTRFIIHPDSKIEYNDLVWSWDNLAYTDFFVVASFQAFSICTKLIYDWLAVQRRMDELEKEKATTELAFLKSQINPHFLFNSINSIYSDIHKENTGARELLLQFSDMLRYQLYECNADKIEIEKEVKYIQSFVALQKKRKNEKLRIDLEFEGDLKNFFIPPLLFIPFIENAFKYVSSSASSDNYIDILLKRHGNMLHFKCMNSKDNFKTAGIVTTGGIGIKNVEQRLKLIYPEKKPEIGITETENSFLVDLTIYL